VSAASGATAPTVTATLACSKCGANLPDEAQFCLKCGKPVSSPAKTAAVADRPVIDALPAELPRPGRKRHIVRWALLAVVIAIIVWLGSSDNPFAQAAQEAVGWKHDQAIMDASFSIRQPSFRYYKIPLAAGSVNVAVVGQFMTASEAGNGKERDKNKDQGDTIEVYVLTEAAFTIWQNGYATSSLYDSGRVAEGTIHADLPAGEGIYYLVFSNKFAPKTAKNVHASAGLHYKSWLPEWGRRMKERLWNWIGL
jgi:hypothetical protein